MTQPIKVLAVTLAIAVCFSYSPVSYGAPDCTNYSSSSLVVFPTVNPVWEMCVRRAQDSTPQPNGSGLELFEVTYNGHLVMERSNVPVLNVQYGNGGCGCFRDWFDSEADFEATTSSCQVTAICEVTSTPTTICDCAPTNSCDADPNNACNTEIGAFRGIAIDRQLSSMSLTTHTRAGWYRYTSKWIFHLDGTIEPQFKFGATPNGCTDASHMHNGYYRFDFDIDNADNDQIYSRSNVLSGLDDDNDSVDNTIDNCVTVSNINQIDADGDGFGNRCDADFNNDNFTNFADLSMFSNAFLSNNPVIDIDSSGTVNFGDLILFAAMFQADPGPAGTGISDVAIDTEFSGFASAAQTWVVRDTVSGRGYEIIPSAIDHVIDNQGGIVDPAGFAVADYWVLNENAIEQTDQGGGCATSLNNYVDGESTADTDVVFWLRFGTHHEGLDECFCGLNGPRLVPVGDWSAAAN